MMRKKLGALLVRSGVITKIQLQVALDRQQRTEERLGRALINCGFATESQILSALSAQLGVQYVDLSRKNIPVGMAELISEDVARKYCLVPTAVTDKYVHVAMADPLDETAIAVLKRSCKFKVVPMVATQVGVEAAIDKLYGGVTEQPAVIGNVPVAAFMNLLLENTAAGRSVDMKMVPGDDTVAVQVKVDGVPCVV